MVVTLSGVFLADCFVRDGDCALGFLWGASFFFFTGGVFFERESESEKEEWGLGGLER